MSSSEEEARRLLSKIRAAGIEVPEGARFERFYHGWAQRAAGAWAWNLVDADGRSLDPPVGSHHPRRNLRGPIAVTYSRHTLDYCVDPA
jgi:hypothetical protein